MLEIKRGVGLDKEMRLENFNNLLVLVNSILGSEWVAFLKSLRYDVRLDDNQYLGFINAPAAKNNHHNYMGGLVVHLMEMWNAFEAWFPFLTVNGVFDDKETGITKSGVLKGILIHDLHKAWMTFVRKEHGFEYGDDVSNGLMTNDQKSLYLLMEYGVKLTQSEMNVLFNSEGGWAKSPPKYCTPLAKLVYILDEISGNVLGRIERKNCLDLYGKKSLDADLLNLTFELF